MLRLKYIVLTVEIGAALVTIYSFGGFFREDKSRKNIVGLTFSLQGKVGELKFAARSYSLNGCHFLR